MEAILKNSAVALKQCRHGYMFYNENDRFIGKSLNLYGEWAESELKLLQFFITRSDTILDIGANIGTHTIFFARYAPHSRVYAFEPQRLSFQMLCANITVNALSNVFAYHNAVSDVPGWLYVPEIAMEAVRNRGAVTAEEVQGGEKVEVVTIDGLNLPQRVGLMKIDVEGMEQKVLQGAATTIYKARPFIFVENSNLEHSTALISLLFEWQYDCWWHITGYYNSDNYFKNPENIFQQYRPEVNMLCAPKEFQINLPLEKVIDVNDNWQQAVQQILKES